MPRIHPRKTRPCQHCSGLLRLANMGYAVAWVHVKRRQARVCEIARERRAQQAETP